MPRPHVKAPYRLNSEMEYVHRAVVEKALGKPLRPGVEVHHLDENTLNNDPSNLVVCPSRAYHMLLHARQRVLDAGGNPNEDKICWTCKQVKKLSLFNNGQGACRPCHSENMKAWHAKRKASQH